MQAVTVTESFEDGQRQNGLLNLVLSRGDAYSNSTHSDFQRKSVPPCIMCLLVIGTDDWWLFNEMFNGEATMHAEISRRNIELFIVEYVKGGSFHFNKKYNT